MLDIKFIRENTDLIKKAAKDKKVDVDIDRIIELDRNKRELQTKIQNLQQERNAHAKSITGKPTDEQIAAGKKIKEELEKDETASKVIEEELLMLLNKVPNAPHSSVPVGKDESENVEIRRWGEPAKFDFKVRDHIELGKLIKGIDVETSALVTGSRFTYLKGDVALLEYGMLQFAIETLTNEDKLRPIVEKIDKNYSTKPFTMVIPPVMIRPEVYEKMARLEPKEERYYIPQDDLYLIGSAEHTLGPIHINQTLNEDELPLRYAGYSTAFRREAGSYGKDMKGILRVHQFNKLEMESFTSAENSIKEQDFFVAIQEYFMQALKIPYRVMMICTGDMSAPDARQIDVECWIPSQNKYRETHTADLMTDYQARRLGTKVRKKDGKTEYAHMNDATAFSMNRPIIAILENYQQEDGSVKVPNVLQKYLGKDVIKRVI